MSQPVATEYFETGNDLLIRRSRDRTPPGSLEIEPREETGVRGKVRVYPVLYSGSAFCRMVIYGLVDPREPDRIRYVGKANRAGLRLAQHFIDGGPRGTWFADMARDGVLPDMVLLEECSKSARGRELHWYNLLRSRGEADLNVQKPLDRLDFATDEERGLTRERARELLEAQEAAFPGTTSLRTYSASLVPSSSPRAAQALTAALAGVAR